MTDFCLWCVNLKLHRKVSAVPEPKQENLSAWPFFFRDRPVRIYRKVVKKNGSGRYLGTIRRASP